MPLLFVVVLVLLAGAPPALAAEWARPMGGDVVQPFDYDRASPFASGRHRGVDLAARAGEAVRAPCAGVVTFAGRVPSRGRGVTIRCGALTATLVELAGVRVARGERVGRGDRVGRAGPRAVHLGARRVGEAFAYVDPTRLFGRGDPPLGPAPPARRGPGGTRPAPTPRRVPAPRAAPASARVTPVGAWVGLGLAAAGLPLGAVVRRRRDRARGAVGRVVAPR